MLGVGRQTRVVDLADAGMVGEVFRHRPGVASVTIHPNPQGLDTAQDQPGVERPGDRTSGVGEEPEPLDQVGVGGDHGAPHHIGVSSQILGGGMDHQCRP